MIVHLIYLQSLKDRIEEIREEAETSVREGSTCLILSDKNINNQKASIPSILTVGAVIHI